MNSLKTTPQASYSGTSGRDCRSPFTRESEALSPQHQKIRKAFLSSPFTEREGTASEEI